MSNAQDELREIMQEVELRNSRMQGLQQVHQTLTDSIEATSQTMETLKRLKNEGEGKPLLVPLRGGVFLKATLQNLDEVIVTYEADVGIEGDVDEARAELETRIEDMRNRIEDVRESIQEEREKLQALQARAQKLAAGEPGMGGPGVTAG